MTHKQQQAQQAGQEKQELLTVNIPETMMRKVEVFCSDRNIPVEQFVIEALAEKMNRWKD